jgi:deoxyribodipyrimidine photo-lyase
LIALIQLCLTLRIGVYGYGKFMKRPPTIVWLRQDLRLADNPALYAAADSGAPLVPVYVHDDLTPGNLRIGGASRWWLHHSLTALREALAERSVSLILRKGRSPATIVDLALEIGAGAVYWNRHYEPHWLAAEREVCERLSAAGVEHHHFPGSLLFEPGSIVGSQGLPLKVFTPFWRHCLAAGAPARPLPSPPSLNDLQSTLRSDSLDSWALLPTNPDWAGGLRDSWRPGERAGIARLEAFLDANVGDYTKSRDRPEPGTTSRLSPHLHFGEISPRQVWHAVRHRIDAAPELASGCEAFLRELGWREFCIHGLVRAPAMAEEPMQAYFKRFPWADDRDALLAWQVGRTGYPIVDAGMRQLWQTGWMHNRVRMIAASFLVKDLLLPWQWGEEWFWDTLVDADMASNASGWQWVAGCGSDAAPYFRVFNPVLQGEKFDSAGSYVRRWIPELQHLPNRWIHRPWDAPLLELNAAGICLGETYPKPMVDHGAARNRALAAFESVKARR